MAKSGGNKKRCEKYKLSGRKEINKARKQERHQRRLEKFRRRREEGKCYQYDPDKYPKTDPSDGNKTEFQKWKSIMAKLNNELTAIEKEEKAKFFKNNKGNSKSSSDE